MEKKRIDRRKLLTDTGKIAGGITLGLAITGLNELAGMAPGNNGSYLLSGADRNDIPELPWPYVALDPEDVRKKGHIRTYEGGCCYGGFAAIFEALREKIGFPYTQIPAKMMVYGRGGMAGMSSLCGALNGASAAIALVSDSLSVIQRAKQLGEWYKTYPFPSDTSNKYAVEHSFLVETYRSDKKLPSSVANSINCDVSMVNWLEVSGLTHEAPERGERCARLVGDVAAQAVIILNNELT